MSDEARIDLDDDVLAPLAAEAGLSLTAAGDVPELTLVARTRDEARTRTALARLQGPLASRLAGGAPFEEGEAGGVPVFTLGVTRELEPSYAVAQGVVVASTARAGLDRLREAKPALTEAPALRRVMPEADAKVQALGFLDLRELLALGERTGFAAGLGSPAVRDDLRLMRAAGAVVEEDPDHPTDTTAELFFEIP